MNFVRKLPPPIKFYRTDIHSVGTTYNKWYIVHNLGTKNVNVLMHYKEESYGTFISHVKVLGQNIVTVEFNAPAPGIEYRVVVLCTN